MTKLVDNQLQESLMMLEKARDHLAQLPLDESTKKVINELSAFLNAHRAQNIPWYSLPWEGESYNEIGQQIIKASLLDTTLTLKTKQTEGQSRRQAANAIYRFLSGDNGLEIYLRRSHFIMWPKL